MVASTKSLWETGEVTAQSAVKSSPCKVQPLEHFPCSCRRQGLVPGHNMNCPCLSCWYILFVGPTSSKGISIRGLPSCCKALHLGDSVFLMGSPAVPWWCIQENLCCWLRLCFEMGIKSAGGENACVSTGAWAELQLSSMKLDLVLR